MDRDQNYVFYGCAALSIGWNRYLDGYGCLGLGEAILSCFFCFGYRVEKAEADNVYSQHKGALFVGQYLVQAAESVSIDGRTIYIVEGRREIIESKPVPSPTLKEDETPGKLATASSGVLTDHSEIATRKKGLDRMAILQKSLGFFLHVDVSLGNFYAVIKDFGKYFEAIREGVSEVEDSHTSLHAIKDNKDQKLIADKVGIMDEKMMALVNKLKYKGFEIKEVRRHLKIALEKCTSEEIESGEFALEYELDVDNKRLVWNEWQVDVLNAVHQGINDYSSLLAHHGIDVETYGFEQGLQPIVDGFKEMHRLFLCVRERLVRKEDDNEERIRKAPLIMKPLYELLLQVDEVLNCLEAFFRLNESVLVNHMGRKEEYLGGLCDKLGYLKPYRRFPEWWKEKHALILQEVQLPQIEEAPGESLEIEEIQDEQEGLE